MKRGQKPIVVIGFCGIEVGVGVSYLSAAVATYASSALGAKTALLECGSQDEWMNMGVLLAENTIRARQFRYQDVTYYTKVEDDHIKELLCLEMEWYILDCGSDYSKARSALLHCTHKFLVGSLAPWKLRKMNVFLLKQEKYEEYLKWTAILTVNDKKRDRIELRQTFGIPVEVIPYIEDPLLLSAETCQEIHKIIGISLEYITKKTNGTKKYIKRILRLNGKRK